VLMTARAAVTTSFTRFMMGAFDNGALL
jgi:hypothetical protein